MVVIEIPDRQAAALEAKAASHGLTLQDWLSKLAGDDASTPAVRTPLKSGRGMLAKYGSAPTESEIDQNRQEMLLGFPQDY